MLPGGKVTTGYVLETTQAGAFQCLPEHLIGHIPTPGHQGAEIFHGGKQRFDTRAMAKVEHIAEEFLPVGMTRPSSPEQVTTVTVVQSGKNSKQRSLARAVRPLDTGQSTGQYGDREIPEQYPVITLTLQIDSL